MGRNMYAWRQEASIGVVVFEYLEVVRSLL